MHPFAEHWFMKVEIWSDVVCPWCYIGKRRFETALEKFDGDVEVEWKAYELDPGSAKVPDGPLDELLAKKYGTSLDKARQMMANITQAARSEGLEFDFDSAQGGNTFDAHRLIHLAKEYGLGDEMKEKLLQAYFVEGAAIHDHAVLADLAAEVGLDRDLASSALADGSFGGEVREEEAEAMEIGVRGVPFFVVEGKYGVSGAQTPDVFLQVLEKAASERKIELVEGSEQCGPDGCAV
jgi:predicted DsbA family dithiol-disulfide isomerase